ncbi:DUF3389 family protein [Thaumasiovibrio sp. DFM-14]|uniref:DUF3389 family protein n=1 Tax=Thaumasiovibrio sp. DFM-14 TaxID=3384792 RepID=UPI0039A07665
MKITFSRGVIYVLAHEVVIRIADDSQLTLKADNESISLFGPARVIAARGNGVDWSLKLDTDEQIMQIATEGGIEVKY